MTNLKLDSVKPLPGYTPSPDLSANPELWQSTQGILAQMLNDRHLTDKSETIKMNPPFILALKALLTHLGNQ
ncbi:MAG: hypothetical protein AAGD25_11275 [Cyanobacteria bacterium P01_F01_bin.150]